MEAYRASLGLSVAAERLGPSNAVRAAQLLNKTNQMNLATRRLTEAQYLQWAALATNYAFVFRVADHFDDYGLTALASLSVNGSEAELSDFVVSCRVMGRGVEQTMLHILVEQARSLGLSRLVAYYAATPRNGPCKIFFDQRSGLAPSEDGISYRWDLTNAYPAPAHVDIHSISDASCSAGQG
jgi:FkbH-like protein